MQAWNEINLLDHDFPIRLLLREKSFNWPHHWHKEIELVYVAKGTLKVEVNDIFYELKSRDILIINPYNVHYFPIQTSDTKNFIIQFNLSMLDKNLSDYNEKKFTKTILSNFDNTDANFNQDIYESVEKVILTIISEYSNKNQEYMMLIKAKLSELMVILLRNLPMEQYTSEEKCRLSGSGKLEILENVFKYAEDNYQNKIWLKDVSQVANFSIYYFTRFFRKSTGVTFFHYLSSFRITKAEWYLRNMEYSITQVSDKCGFESIKTFNRVFKKYKGCSPSIYKSKI